MFSFQPRTTPAADLELLSRIERKPKKLGTETKSVAGGGIGVMWFMEIQEGAEAMVTKKHRVKKVPATAQAVQLFEACAAPSFLEEPEAPCAPSYKPHCST